MPAWKLSRYTVVLKCESGDALLHNSFMGAIAQIPASEFNEIEEILYQVIEEDQLNASSSLKELCANGFFFPTHIDERDFVSNVLERESRDGNLDLILLPHENCNFRCNYCYETHQGGKMEPGIIQGLMSFVDDKAMESRSISVRWFGGEPLLAKDIIYQLSDSFIQTCEKNAIPYFSHITTNAYLLTPEVFDELIKRKVNDFQVTFDGPEITHDTSRTLAGGGKTFNTILNNLIEMKRTNREFSVSVRVNFNDDSIEVMEEFFHLMSKTFGDDARFGLYFRPIGKYGGPNDHHIKVCETTYGRLMEIELTKKYLPFGYLDSVFKRGLQSHGQVCYAGKSSSMVIGADGTIYKCSVAFEDPLNKVGRLLPDGSLDINQSLWDMWVTNKDVDDSKCTSCPVSPLCQGKYCPKHAIREKKPICPMTPTEYFGMIQLVSSGNERIL